MTSSSQWDGWRRPQEADRADDDAHALRRPRLPPVRDRARRSSARLRAELGFEVDEVDITGVPELEQRYREWLPVIELDGRAAFGVPRRGGRAAAAIGGAVADAAGSEGPSAQWPNDVASTRRGSCGEQPCRRRRRGAPFAVPPGPDPGQEDGQGPHLLAGDRGLHEHQRDADPARPLELRQVRQARRRLLDRRPARRDPQDPAHAGPAQHRPRRRRPSRPGDRRLVDLRRARDHDRGGVRHRRAKIGPPIGSVEVRPTTSG